MVVRKLLVPDHRNLTKASTGLAIEWLLIRDKACSPVMPGVRRFALPCALSVFNIVIMLHIGLLLIPALLFTPQSPAASAGGGSVCIPPLPESSAVVGDPPMAPPGQYISPRGTLQVQVDGNKPVTLSPTSGGTIGGLSPRRKHLLRIKRAGRTLASFRFSFAEEGTNKLCLWYHAGYGTFTLKPAGVSVRWANRWQQ